MVALRYLPDLKQLRDVRFMSANGWSRLLPGVLLSFLGTSFSVVAGPDEEAAVEVTVVTVQAEDHVLQRELAGRVSALRVAEVRPQVRGIIEQRLFDEGSDVAAGDLLYQINSDSYRVELARSQAELAAAQASLVHLRSVAERYTRLLRSKSVNQVDYDQAQARYQQGLADVAARKAAVDASQLTLKRTQVRAPIAGRIGRSAVSEGALVSTDQVQALATIQQFDPVYVDIVQSSKQLLEYKRRLTTGELVQGSAAVTLLLEDGKPYGTPGELKLTELNVDQQTGSVTLRAKFANPNGLLLPGMYVRAKVAQGAARQVILLPQQAVLFRAGQLPAAWRVGDDNRVSRQPLQLLESHGQRWVVSSGLSAGDRVVVEGSHRLTPKALVNPVGPDVPAVMTVVQE